MNVGEQNIIVQSMPCVSTMLVATHVTAKKASLEMASLVMVGNWNYGDANAKTQINIIRKLDEKGDVSVDVNAKCEFMYFINIGPIYRNNNFRYRRVR